MPLADAIYRRQKWVKPLNPKHFFPAVRKWMQLGIAKVWGSDNSRALLIAMFMPNAYTGEMSGLIFTWWSDGPTTDVFERFEEESKRCNCAQIYSSVFGNVRMKSVERLYRMKGFELHEQVFRKIYG